MALKAFVQSAPGLRPISSRLAQATTSPSAKHRGCFPFYLALSLSLSGQSITTGGFLECCNASHLPSPQPRVDLRQRLHFDVTAHLVCRSSSPPDGLPTGTRQQEESVIKYLWEILEEGIFLSPLPLVFLDSPRLPVPGLQLSGIPYLSPHPSHTPEPALSGGICIFYPTSRAGVGPQILHLNPELLRVGFLKGSQEEWLHWNLQLWVRRSR